MTKNKSLLTISLLSLLVLASCQGGAASASDADPSTSSDEAVSSSESTSEAEALYPENPDFEDFGTVTELINFLKGSGLSHEAAHASSFLRSSYSYMQGMFQVEETNAEEEGFSYADNVSAMEGSITTEKYGDDILPDTTEEDAYQMICVMDDANFTQVIDYRENGKENDEAFREAITSAHQALYEKFLGTNTLSSVLSYYDAYYASSVVSGFDAITPTIDEKNGKVIYRLERTEQEPNGGYIYQISVGFDFVFDRNGALLEHGFQYLENEVTDPSNPIKLMAMNEETSLYYEGKSDYDGSSIDPKEYFLADYSIGLVAYDSVDPNKHDIDPLNFPYGDYVDVEVKTCTPEKALDIGLEIVSSSNEKAIERIDYLDGSHAYRATGVGTSTLTVRSESGIEKQIEVTVVAPEMETISANLYSALHFVGEDESLYISYEPDNTLQTIAVRALTPEIATVSQDDRGYYNVHNLAVGEASFEVYCVENPKVKTIVTYEVSAKLSEEEAKAKFASSTFYGDLQDESGKTVKNAVKVEIKDETHASFTFASDKLGYYFVKDQPYEVEYALNEENYRKDRLEFHFGQIATTSPSGNTYVFDDITCEFFLNGLDYRFSIGTKNMDEFYITPLVWSGRLAA